jgi:hypothetical protein
MNISGRLPHRASAIVCATIVASFAQVACDDDPVTPGNPQDISISLNPDAITLLQGDEASVTVTLESTGGFEETVTLFAEDPPNGVAISTETIDGGSGMATLDIDVGVFAEKGSASITVSATAPGVATASTTFDLTVSASGGFALTVSPNPVGMVLGDTATATIGIGRTPPFSGPVNLAVAGVPALLTATLDSMTVAGDSAILTLVADTALALEGRYTLIVGGSGDGVADELTGVLVVIVR